MAEQEFNSYLEYAKTEFLDTITKRSDMLNDFRTDTVESYQEMNKIIIKHAVELLKLGVPFKYNGDEHVSLIIDDNAYDISKKEIKKMMEEKQYQAIFHTEHEKETYFDDDEYDENYSAPENPLSMPIKDVDPYTAMMQYFMLPLASMAAFNYGARAPHPVSTYKASSSDDQLSDIVRSLAEIQKKVVTMEKEKSGATKNVSNLKYKYDELKHELASADEQIAQMKAENENQKAAFELERADFEKICSDAKSEKAAYEEELAKVKTELSYKQEHIEEIEKIKVNLENRVQVLTTEITSVNNASGKDKEKIGFLENSLQAKKNELEGKNKTVSELSAKITEKDELIKQKDNQLNELRTKSENEKNDAQKRYSDKLQSLQTELNSAKMNLANEQKRSRDKIKEEQQITESLKKENERITNLLEAEQQAKKELEQQLISMKAELQAKDTEYSNVSSAKEKLEQMAYIDKKTGVLNENAFNRDFSGTDKGGIILAYIGICGMKKINDSFGKSSGDNVITKVADEIRISFPDEKNSVYRVVGDKFIILFNNKTLNAIQGQLVDLQSKLSSQQINVVYGTAIGNNCRTHGEMIMVAEEMMNKMKNAPVQAPYAQSMYQSLQNNYEAAQSHQNAASSNNYAAEELNIEDEMLMEYMSGQ